MNSRLSTIPLWAAACVLLLATLARAAALSPMAVYADGTGGDYYIATVGIDESNQPQTSIRERVDATTGKWVEIAALRDSVTAIATVDHRLAIATADGWRLVWKGGGVNGPALPNGRTISRLAGDGDALWALSGPELFRWTSSTGWSQRGTLLAEATAQGTSIAVRDGTPWTAFLQGDQIHVTRAEASGWKPITLVPKAVAFKLLLAGPTPLLATADEQGVWTIYDLAAQPAKAIQTLDLGRPGDLTIAGSTLRAVNLNGDGIHQIAIDNFGRGTRSGPDLIAQVNPPLPQSGEWPSYLLTGMMFAAMLIALRTRSSQREEQARSAETLPIAPIGRRIAAGVIDAVPYLITLVYAMNRMEEDVAAGNAMSRELYLVMIAGLAVYVAHVTVSELLFGRSLGKFLFGLRVVTLDGKKPARDRIILRNLMRVVDVGLGLPFLLVILLPAGQRFGDMAARTVVIRDEKIENDSNQDEQDSGQKSVE